LIKWLVLNFVDYILSMSVRQLRDSQLALSWRCCFNEALGERERERKRERKKERERERERECGTTAVVQMSL